MFTTLKSIEKLFPNVCLEGSGLILASYLVLYTSLKAINTAANVAAT